MIQHRILLILIIVLSIFKISKSDCSYRKGCYKGYCWRGCNNPFSFFDRAWCWTEDSTGLFLKPCEKDTECDGCWKCPYEKFNICGL